MLVPSKCKNEQLIFHKSRLHSLSLNFSHKVFKLLNLQSVIYHRSFRVITWGKNTILDWKTNVNLALSPLS